jgi:hypothetical protein
MYILTDEEMKALEELAIYYDEALEPCDPLDFQVRQRNLLLCLARTILIPLDEKREDYALDKIRESVHGVGLQ